MLNLKENIKLTKNFSSQSSNLKSVAILSVILNKHINGSEPSNSKKTCYDGKLIKVGKAKISVDLRIEVVILCDVISD